MKYIKVVIFLILPSAISLFSGEVEKKISLFSKAYPVTEFIVMTVPSAGNFISNKLVVASLNSGTQSLSAIQLSVFLANKEVRKILVVGDNDDTTAATIRNAIKSLTPDQSTTHEIGFVGRDKYQEQLEELTSKYGFKFYFVSQN